MRGGLGASFVALTLGCGQSEGSPSQDGVATSTGDETTTGATTTGPASSDAESTTADDDTTDPWDRSECVRGLSGPLEWSFTARIDFDIAGGRDLARAPARSIYLLDDGISRWTEDGELSWQRTDPGASFTAMAIDDHDRPVVVGSFTQLDDFEGLQALVASVDTRGMIRWSQTIDDVPLAQQIATDVVVDRNGEIVVAGLLWLPGEPYRAWLARLDPDGETRWKRVLLAGSEAEPRLAIDGDGAVVLAEQRRGEQGIEQVVLTKYDADGGERWEWNSIEGIGYPLWLDALAVDPDGFIALAGRDPAQVGAPRVLSLLDRDGRPQWVRTSVDVRWLETVEVVAFDRCGTLVIGGAGDPGPSAWGELWLAKIGREGEVRWSYFAPTSFFSLETHVAAIELEPDGGMLVTGANVLGQDQNRQGTFFLVETWVGRLGA